MPNTGPDNERLDRLRDLSAQIAAAMAEMLAFQTHVKATLRKIAKARGVDLPPVRPSPRSGPRNRGSRKRTRRAA